MLTSTLGYQELEYAGTKYMPYSTDRFHIKASEDYSLLNSWLLHNEGVVFTYENAPEAHFDCIKLIPIHGDYTYPIFIYSGSRLFLKRRLSVFEIFRRGGAMFGKAFTGVDVPADLSIFASSRGSFFRYSDFGR